VDAVLPLRQQGIKKNTKMFMGDFWHTHFWPSLYNKMQYLEHMKNWDVWRRYNWAKELYSTKYGSVNNCSLVVMAIEVRREFFCRELDTGSSLVWSRIWILLSLPPKFWDNRSVLPHPASEGVSYTIKGTLGRKEG
jgi:hypothetical protein